MSTAPADDLERALWPQVARPCLLAHPDHGTDGNEVLMRLWGATVVWELEHLQALPAVVRLGAAPLAQLQAVVRSLGLVPYGKALRETLSGTRLKQIERALGREDWARLIEAEASYESLAPTEHRPLAELLEAKAPGALAERLDRLGTDTLAGCFAAWGEPWRLRLGLRLPPGLHEAVLAAVPCDRELAQARLHWALALLPSINDSPPSSSTPVESESQS